MVPVLETPYHRFVALALFDRRVVDAEHELRAAEGALADARGAWQRDMQVLEQERAQVHELKKQKTVLEHELLALQQELGQKKIRMDQTRDAREYGALLHEIESLTGRCAAKEDEVLALWQQVEDVEPTLAQLVESQRPLEEKHLLLIKEREAAIAEKKQALALLKEGRAEKLVGILPDWLERYEAMRRHLDVPAVPLEKNLCAGCGSVVPPATQIAVRHHQLAVCQQCRRLLFVADVPTDFSTNPSDGEQ